MKEEPRNDVVAKTKTLAQAKDDFIRTGKSIASWAREHGVSPPLVRMILSGKRPGYRGQSHRIAVLLGIKDGVINGN